MSTYYYVYAEGKVREKKTGQEKWMSLNPVFQTADGSYKTGEITYFTHSSMADVYYALAECTVARGIPEDGSAALLAQFHNLDEMTDEWGVKRTWRELYKRDVIVVNYVEAIKNRVKKDRPYKYMYFVPRETMASFECGEIDSIDCWLTREEYMELDDDERQAYVYYEWNNWWDEYQMFCRIRDLVDAQIEFYNQMNWELGTGEVADGDVRLIVRRC